MAVMQLFLTDQGGGWKNAAPLFYYGVLVMSIPGYGLAEWELQVCSFREPVEVAVGRRWDRVS